MEENAHSRGTRLGGLLVDGGSAGRACTTGSGLLLIVRTSSGSLGCPASLTLLLHKTIPFHANHYFDLFVALNWLALSSSKAYLDCRRLDRNVSKWRGLLSNLLMITMKRGSATSSGSSATCEVIYQTSFPLIRQENYQCHQTQVSYSARRLHIQQLFSICPPSSLFL
jgi:hypothetical protein